MDPSPNHFPRLFHVRKSWKSQKQVPEIKERVISEKKRPLPGNRGLSSEWVFTTNHRIPRFQVNSRVPWGIPWQETDKKIVSARSDFLRETSSLIRLLSELQLGGGLISYPFSHIKD